MASVKNIRLGQIHSEERQYLAKELDLTYFGLLSPRTVAK